MSYYYSSKFFSNGTASTAPTEYHNRMPLPTKRGEILCYDVTVTGGGASTPFTSSDTVYLARKPAGVTVTDIVMYIPDWDTGGSALAVNIGTTATAAQYAAAIVIGTAGTFRTQINGATTGPSAAFTTAAISSDENITLIPTANATTGSSGVGYFRIYYTSLDNGAADPTNSPATVVGTQ